MEQHLVLLLVRSSGQHHLHLVHISQQLQKRHATAAVSAASPVMARHHVSLQSLGQLSGRKLLLVAPRVLCLLMRRRTLQRISLTDRLSLRYTSCTALASLGFACWVSCEDMAPKWNHHASVCISEPSVLALGSWYALKHSGMQRCTPQNVHVYFGKPPWKRPGLSDLQSCNHLL